MVCIWENLQSDFVFRFLRQVWITLYERQGQAAKTGHKYPVADVSSSCIIGRPSLWCISIHDWNRTVCDMMLKTMRNIVLLKIARYPNSSRVRAPWVRCEAARDLLRAFSTERLKDRQQCKLKDTKYILITHLKANYIKKGKQESIGWYKTKGIFILQQGIYLGEKKNYNDHLWNRV